MARRFSHRLRVRYSECDFQGIVYNAHYLAYFDVALTELWREAIGPYHVMVESGTDMVVGEARARFVSPARFDEELDLEVAVSDLGETTLDLKIDALREGRLLVEGRMRHVFVDPKTRARKPMPPAVREALEAYHEGDPKP